MPVINQKSRSDTIDLKSSSDKLQLENEIHEDNATEIN